MHTEPNSSAEYTWSNFTDSLFVGGLIVALGLLALQMQFANLNVVVSAMIACVIFYLSWECFIHTYLVVRYSNGKLEAIKPKEKYSLFQARKERALLIDPDEWDEILVGKSKYSRTLIFSKNKHAVYAIHWSG